MRPIALALVAALSLALVACESDTGAMTIQPPQDTVADGDATVDAITSETQQDVRVGDNVSVDVNSPDLPPADGGPMDVPTPEEVAEVVEVEDLDAADAVEVQEVSPDTEETTPDAEEVTPCDVLEPLPFVLNLSVNGQDPWSEWGPGWSYVGAAVVADTGLIEVSYDGERWLRLDLAGSADADPAADSLTVSYRLPQSWRLPIRRGDEVQVSFELQAPWWVDAALQIATPDGRIMADVVHRSWSGPYVEETCAPEPGTCGMVQHGRVVVPIGADGTMAKLGQGELAALLTAAGRFRALVARVYLNVTMDCMDYPMGWLSYAVVNNESLSQPRCLSPADCAAGVACDAATERCADACDPDRLALTAANPEAFELYAICLPQAGMDPTTGLQAIDPSIQCGTSLAPWCQDISDASCIGELAFEPGTKQITADKMAQLCGLSLEPYIDRIVGGHYLY